MKFLDFVKNNVVCLDGGCGTYLQKNGLAGGELPERWNVSHGEVITGMHKAYYDAGSNVVFTNTFGANAIKYSDEELEAVVTAAVANAKAAREQSAAPQEKFVALDIGPLGKLLKPMGDLEFDDAVAIFAKTVRFGVAAGVDLVVVETMSDSYETKAAVVAVKENCDLPVLVTNAYGEGGRLMTGASPAVMVAMLEGLGVDLIGANCSLGPKQLRGIVTEILAAASVPVVLKPNAGLPRIEDGKTVFDVTMEEFAEEVADMVRSGVRAVGGCCGTTPEYIACLNEKLQGVAPVALVEKDDAVATSSSRTVSFGDDVEIAALDPEENEDYCEALQEGELDDVMDEAYDLQDDEPDMIAVSVAAEGVDEEEMLAAVVEEMQAVIKEPLLLQSANAAALDKALRRYNGRPAVKLPADADMTAVAAVVKKYGALVLAEEEQRETLLSYGVKEKSIIC